MYFYWQTFWILFGTEAQSPANALAIPCAYCAGSMYTYPFNQPFSMSSQACETLPTPLLLALTAAWSLRTDP